MRVTLVILVDAFTTSSEVFLILAEFLTMLRDAAAHARAPAPERGWLEVLAHDFNDVRFAQSSALLDVFKGRSIFPCHADDLIDLIWSHGER